MKSYISIVVLALLFCNCTKNSSEDMVIAQKNLLSKNTSGIGKWKLTNLSISFVSQSLSPVQSAYTKQYTIAGNFSDSDGSMGSWSMPDPTTLIENFTNFSSGVSVSQTYKINSITATQLNLTYTNNATEITTNYQAVP
jgi:hypothetical protein